MSKIYVVVEGGCVRYISSAAVKHTAVVIDLDDYEDAPDEEREETEKKLAEAERLPRIW